MTSVPLGKGAYERQYAGTPQVQLLNRWLEANPANPREGTSVLARPGTTRLLTLKPGNFMGLGAMRGCFALDGLFDNSLFTVCGSNLYRINQDMSIVQITGAIAGTGTPEAGWQRGAGYERLWISDGETLQYYSGTSVATGTLTKINTITNNLDTFEIGGVYYTWGTNFNPSDQGTVIYPYKINPTATLGSILDPMNQLVLAVMATGVPGTDYSATIVSPNSQVTAKGDGNAPAVSVVFSSIVTGTSGNSIQFLVTAGNALTASSSTLIGGGTDQLNTCPIPGGLLPTSITQVSSYLLVAIANSQQFYWVNPGDVTIDPLNFASKESSPDDIICMRAVGDQVLIIGNKSTENWYATGNSQAPFAPIEGRVYARGAITGSPVVVDDGVVLVGNDGRVYNIGYAYGDNTDAGFGVVRISNNGIEERIRLQTKINS